MFKEMRKNTRKIPTEEIVNVLEKGEYGVLATVGENGYPYSLPISYVYFNDAIYFHCAIEGQKLDNIKFNSKVSFSIVTDTEVIPNMFTTKYKSVVVYGEAINAEGEEKEQALFELIKKYSESFIKEGKEYIEKGKGRTSVIKININHITGKGRL
ncbi:pyridoxamine 5'-phosphate oxidase family protein [Clostridium paraputrificum]|uniref:pyridoxamine 5'-phosphate oxidase family protein n=1 Tax=Clostridium TaxID=1485 RepID=UPI003D341DBD